MAAGCDSGADSSGPSRGKVRFGGKEESGAEVGVEGVAHS